ncbi:MAG TPA: lipid IV(A) 3-deoxy-D-manno-octulosonic acid transferase [Methylococcus sp.]|nr:lipid IV(A) 3-deoxy-D-manno-octulosonic acid transferase [Methylococcus sp.]
MRGLYTVLFYASVPWMLLRLFWRGRRNAAYRERWGERFALYRRPRRTVDIWIHAVSVGEAEAAFALVREIRRHGAWSILVTTTTPTGSARVREVLGDTVEHVYLPYDLPDGAARFLDHFSPHLAVILETEIWPNLFLACAKRGIPLFLANARLSERSARRYRRIRGTLVRVLAGVRVAAQTEDDAHRFVSIGARSEAISVTGNLKFDAELTAPVRDTGVELRRRWFGEGPVWLAASTHPGEEIAALDAWERLRHEHPGLRLVLAPRHPERFEEVARLCESRGYHLARRTQGERGWQSFDVFLLDTLGELKAFYVASDIAFVGGSLAAVGGHNVLEAAAAGTALVFGPNTWNFRQICDDLVGESAALRVGDSGELAEAVARLARDPVLRETLVRCAFAFVERNRGAVERHWRLLAPVLEVQRSRERGIPVADGCGGENSPGLQR